MPEEPVLIRSARENRGSNVFGSVLGDVGNRVGTFFGAEKQRKLKPINFNAAQALPDKNTDRSGGIFGAAADEARRLSAAAAKRLNTASERQEVAGVQAEADALRNRNILPEGMNRARAARGEAALAGGARDFQDALGQSANVRQDQRTAVTNAQGIAAGQTALGQQLGAVSAGQGPGVSSVLQNRAATGGVQGAAAAARAAGQGSGIGSALQERGTTGGVVGQAAAERAAGRGGGVSPLLQQAAEGGAPSEAEAVLNQSIDESIRAAQAQAAAQGTPAAFRNAQQVAADLNAKRASELGRLRAQEMATARGQAAEFQGQQAGLQADVIGTAAGQAAGLQSDSARLEADILGTAAGQAAGLQGQALTTRAQQELGGAELAQQGLQTTRTQDLQQAEAIAQEAQGRAQVLGSLDANDIQAQLGRGDQSLEEMRINDAAAEATLQRFADKQALGQQLTAQEEAQKRALEAGREQLRAQLEAQVAIAESGNQAMLIANSPSVGQTLLGAGATAVGGLASAGLLSDRRTKHKVSNLDDANLKKFMRALRGYNFEYKPGLKGTAKGKRVGVMAQDLERSKVGKTLVSKRPDGLKQIDVGQGLGVALASLANLNKRLDAVGA